MRTSAFLLLAALAASAVAQDEGRVHRLLADLESAEWQVREDATIALLDVGLEGEAAIAAALASGSPEVRGRLERVLAGGFLGAMREPRSKDLLERWWDSRSEEIGIAFADRFPSIERPGRFRVAEDEPATWGDWRDVRFPPSRVVGEEEPDLHFQGATLLSEAIGTHHWMVYVLEPGTAAVLARADGTRAMRELGDLAQLRAFLVLETFGVIDWSRGAAPEPRDGVAGLRPDRYGETGVRYVLECFVGE